MMNASSISETIATRLAIATCLAVATFAGDVSGALPTLVAGGTTLQWTQSPDGITPTLSPKGGDASLAAQGATHLMLLDGNSESTQRIDVRYQAVSAGAKGEAIATARVTTPGGSILDFTDTWSAEAVDAPAIVLKRSVRVMSVKGGDRAFGTAFAFAVPKVATLAAADVFIPGLWYATAANTPKSGLITDVGQRDFILREDRMTLPLVSVRDRASGASISLEHRSPDGATIAKDDTLDRLIDARLRFGSLGIRRGDASASSPLQVVFCFPGTEGEQTGIFGYKPDRRTVERLHPMIVGAMHTYTLAFRRSTHADFPTQMRSAWRAAYASAKPAVVAAKIQDVYAASVGALDHYWYAKPFEQSEVAGIPFGVALPGGEVKDPSLQMGFVGQQLPCASYLIDEGIRANRSELIAKGERIVDFWAKHSLSDAGVPRTWFDLTPTPRWRNYNTFLRVATDGTSGMLRAWQIERAAKRDKRVWLAFCGAVGDWLIRIQNEDGSFYREWTFDGTPASESKTSTLHPVRLLVDLSCATGDMKYRAAAIRAAQFAVKENATGARYVGGTPDNPDVVDKEAGYLAMEAYLALYDVTQDKQWLAAAVDAASFTETWIYAWNVPLPIDKQDVGVPRVKTFAGTNLIATGHSGSDNFLAYGSFAYVRLWLYTGDVHWLDVATLLQHNSAQFVETGKQSANSLGYAVQGLQVEAFSLAVNRGHSVRIWLPWLTSATLEPMARLREAFGVIDVNELRSMDAAERVRRNHEFAKRRGFEPPESSLP